MTDDQQKIFDEVARQRAVNNVSEDDVIALCDKLADTINASKSTMLVVINALMLNAADIAIKCGSTADDFADGARRTCKMLQERGGR